MEAVVLFDYEKQQDDELDLTVGSTIQNVTQVDDGWCQGTYGGKTGMFPDNFVQLKPVTVPPPVAAAPIKPQGKPPPPDPTPTPSDPIVTRQAAQRTKSRRAKVTFSYAAENPDELTLQPGQSVDVLGEEEDGWWRGQVGDRTGLFPSNFVEIITEETTPSPSTKDPPPAPHDMSDGGPPQMPPLERRINPPVGVVAVGTNMLPKFNPADAKMQLKRTVPPPAAKEREEPVRMPELRRKAPQQPLKAQAPAKLPAVPPQEPALERAKVVFAYTSEQEDELTIQTGDILEVVDKAEQDGWWKVKLNGRVGLVPDNFVELLPSQPAKEPPATEPLHKKEPRRPAPAPVVQDLDSKSDFGVPDTDQLDNSAVKGRAHRPVGSIRPPSRSNLQNQEGGGDGKGAAEAEEAPWQKELKSRKKNPVKPPPPKPQAPPDTEKKPPPPRTTSKPALVDKPKLKPPPAKPMVDTVKPPPPASAVLPSTRPTPSSVETSHTKSPSKPSEPSPPPSSPSYSAAVHTAEWKEALEKLREEFVEFKTQLRKEMKTLSNDLDEERKTNASLRIDLDRLKKTQL